MLADGVFTLPMAQHEQTAKCIAEHTANILRPQLQTLSIDTAALAKIIADAVVDKLVL